ncbi:uncharacterized protein [Parasteatoda tepidariorum]|uniref:uncharacterized protein n=1 Tax=Parasteatoda tepidariorum TaxID=114398 RepID=UPI0039BD3A01
MMFSSLLKVGRYPFEVRNGFLCLYRMCKNENKYTHQSSNQPTSQAQDGTYKVPEYYEYKEYSFNDLLSDMRKYHLPRPSSKVEKDKK